MTLVLRVLARAVALVPWAGLAQVGALLGWFVGSVLRVRRAAVVAAMERATVGDAEREARAMYAGLGTGVLELLWLSGANPHRRAQTVRDVVAFDAAFVQAFQRACARGPVVLAASHTANWELVAFGAAHLLATKGKRLAVVVKPVSNGAIDAFCTHLRRECGLDLLLPEGMLREARLRLRSGDVVAMPIDQVPERARHGIRVPFLGASVHADRALAALARATGATVIVAAAAREGRTQQVRFLAEVIPPSGSPDTATAASPWIASATREITESLETFVRAHPSSWLWLHRRWRAPFELGGTNARPARQATRLVATGHPG